MNPPSYEEAIATPPQFPPPPISNNPATRYNEIASSQPDPFPLLLLPRVSSVRLDSQGSHVHSLTQINVRDPDRRTQNRDGRSQRPVPILLKYLRDSPGLVQCPRCSQTVTTKIAWKPKKMAWCWCCLMASFGMFCGCCLIMLLHRSFQNAHHSCPHCKKQIHVYTGEL